MSVAPLDRTHRAAWDDLVAIRGAGFMQSWAWSEFKELEGYRAVRLGLFDSESLTGGAIAYVFPTPAEGQLAAVPDGPVIDWRSPAASAMFGALVSAFESATARERVVMLRLEPRLEFLPAALDGLPQSPVDLVPVETLEVDLGQEALMLAAMKPKGRYNIRLAQRHGEVHGAGIVGDTDDCRRLDQQDACEIAELQPCPSGAVCDRPAKLEC